MVMIICDILFTDVVADADNESADAEAETGAHAHPTTPVRTHPRPCDVLTSFLCILIEWNLK